MAPANQTKSISALRALGTVPAQGRTLMEDIRSVEDVWPPAFRTRRSSKLQVSGGRRTSRLQVTVGRQIIRLKVNGGRLTSTYYDSGGRETSDFRSSSVWVDWGPGLVNIWTAGPQCGGCCLWNAPIICHTHIFVTTILSWWEGRHYHVLIEHPGREKNIKNARISFSCEMLVFQWLNVLILPFTVQFNNLKRWHLT